MKDVLRITVAAIVATAAFLGAVVLDLRKPPDRGCIGDAPTARSYTVRIEETPSPETSTYHLAVMNGTGPVSGARVCVFGRMDGMPSMGINDEARDVGGGRYRVSMNTAMAGLWKGQVRVAAPGRPAVAVPLTFDVLADGTSARGCGPATRSQTAYTVKLDQPAKRTVTAYHLSLLKAGQPVTGARVCIDAEMNGMPAMGVTGDGKEVGPGRYAVELKFGMSGVWRGTVLVAEPGMAAFSMPLSVRVTSR